MRNARYERTATRQRSTSSPSTVPRPAAALLRGRARPRWCSALPARGVSAGGWRMLALTAPGAARLPCGIEVLAATRDDAPLLSLQPGSQARSAAAASAVRTGGQRGGSRGWTWDPWPSAAGGQWRRDVLAARVADLEALLAGRHGFGVKPWRHGAAAKGLESCCRPEGRAQSPEPRLAVRRQGPSGRSRLSAEQPRPGSKR